MKPKKTPDDVYELSVIVPSRLPAAVEVVRMVLVGCGISDGELVESCAGGASSLSVYGVSRPGVHCLRQRVEQLSLRGLKVRERRLEARDWQDRWKREIKPFVLTKRLMVVPAWSPKRKRSSKRIVITLDTTLAFGTGLHETTRFMAQLIEQCRGRFERFLDIGAGSGILSVVAFHSGATKVRAIDYDPSSLAVARANLAANGFPPRCAITADLSSWRERRQYDFVAANLTSRDLIVLSKQIFARIRPGKYLALSGIGLANLAEVQEHYRSFPLRCLKIMRGKEWAALLYQRRERE